MKSMRLAVLLTLFFALFFLTVPAGAETLTLPPAVTDIGPETFAGTESLDEVMIPEGVISIQSLAFSGSGVHRIYLPASLEYIAPDAFDGCTGMTASVTVYSYAEEYCREHEIPYECEYTDLSEFTFSYPDEHTAIITGWNGEGNVVIIPRMADETHEITAIGTKAFMGQSRLVAVWIPDAVTIIGSSAFANCTGMVQITLPAGLQTLESSAFAGCEALTGVIFNDGLQMIGESAFSRCTSLMSAELPDSVTQIGPNAFSSCTSMASFRYPLSLQAVTGSDGGAGLFSGCSSLIRVTVPEGIEKLAPRIFKNSCIQEVVLPSTLKTIGHNAFTGTMQLQAISLPASLKTIESGAFSNCGALRDIAFSDGLTTIGEAAFSYCASLTEVNLPDSVEQIGPNAFLYCSELASFRYPLSLQTVSGPDGGAGIFVHCPLLTNAEIPEGVETLAPRVFKNSSIEEIRLPSTLKTIGYAAFSYAQKLQAIDLPPSLEMIGPYAFQNSGLTSVDLPESLRRIDLYAFASCQSLESVGFNEGLTEINEFAFFSCPMLTAAELPESVDMIGEKAFANDTALASVHYPSGLERIGGHASELTTPFHNCTSLKKVAVTEGTEVLPAFLFRYDEPLTKVGLPSTLKEIQTKAFDHCTSLPWLYVPVSVSSLGENVFRACPELTVESECGSAAITYCKANGIPYYYLSSVGFTFPEVVYQTIGTTITGKITAGDALRSTTVTLADGEKVSVSMLPLKLTGITVKLTQEDTGTDCLDSSIEPDVSQYPYADLLNSIDFAALDLGHYRLVIAASTEISSETLVDISFEVQEPPLMVEISEEHSLPERLMTVNNAPELSGILTANYPMTEIKATICNSDGTLFGTYVITPNTYTADLSELANLLPVFQDIYKYLFTLEVSGHDETDIFYQTEIITHNSNDSFGRMPDSLFSGSNEYGVDQRATWSAYFAQDCYSWHMGRAVAQERAFNNRWEYTDSRVGDKAVMMWKDIQNADGKYTRLWALGIRGTDAKSLKQWNDNLTNVGYSEYHRGFYHLALAILDAFNDYQERINTAYPKQNPEEYTKDDKIWVCGHSRGAAAANILGGDLLHNQAGFPEESIYAFCFACPRVTKGDTAYAGHVNVYNIAGDLVPKLPLEAWGYSWHGRVHTSVDAGSICTPYGYRLILYDSDTDAIAGLIRTLPGIPHNVMAEIYENINFSSSSNILQRIVEAVVDIASRADGISEIEAGLEVYKTLFDLYVTRHLSLFQGMINSHDVGTYFYWCNEKSPMI